ASPSERVPEAAAARRERASRRLASDRASGLARAGAYLRDVDVVLACVDRTPSARRVLDTAARVAAALRAKLFVLHVAPAEPEWVGWGPGPQTVRDAVARDLRSAHREVQALADGVRAGGAADVTALMIQGPVAETILAQAEALDASFIVVGA